MPQTVYLTKYPAHIALTRKLANKPENGWDITSPIFRHRAVMALFSDLESSTPRTDLQVLFRLDFITGQAPYFLVQSNTAPDNTADISTHIETKEITLHELVQGTPVSFRLAVNAVKRRQQGGITPIPYDTEDNPAFSEWLQQKLRGALQEISITTHQRQVLGADRKGSSGDKNDRVVQVDTVDGFAIVANPENLQNLILNGVGRAKSYGCGLLSIQPLTA